MTPLGSALFDAWPYLFALLFGVLAPRRQGWLERVSLGIIAVLAVAFIRGLWPEASGAEEAAPPPVEWPHLLNVIVFVPLVAAVAVLFLPRQAPGMLRKFTMVALCVDLVASLFLLRAPMTRGWHFQYITEWLPSFGIRYHVAVDGISLWMVLLTTLTTPVAALVSFGSIKRRTKELCFALLLLHAGMLGAFVALDLFLFYVFWELMLVPMFIMIGIWGGIEKIKASYKFFLYTMTGGVLMLAAILYLVWTHQQVAGYPTFDYLALSRLVLPRTAAWLCFAGFAAAFLVKVPMWPLHTWLPDAHVQAPTGGSIVLAAVLLKLGTYGYLRFAMGLFGDVAYIAAPTLAGAAVLGGILYGALVSWKQPDIKRLVAYSSVAHMGFVMLGLFAATQASIEGAMLTMVNHGVTTGALFLLVGVVYDRRHTRMVDEFGGLAKIMPVYATLFVIVSMASVGVPGTNGFIGEFMVIVGTFASDRLGHFGKLHSVLAASGVILAAVYMLGMVQKVFFGPLSNPKNASLKDVNSREVIALAPLVAFIFIIGWFPALLIKPMSPSVTAAMTHYLQARQAGKELPLDAKQAILMPRPEGALGTGYPEKPEPKPEGGGEVADAAQPAGEKGGTP